MNSTCTRREEPEKITEFRYGLIVEDGHSGYTLSDGVAPRTLSISLSGTTEYFIDDGEGDILPVNGALGYGKIDYDTGKIDIRFVKSLYVKGKINAMTTYLPICGCNKCRMIRELQR